MKNMRRRYVCAFGFFLVFVLVMSHDAVAGFSLKNAVKSAGQAAGINVPTSTSAAVATAVPGVAASTPTALLNQFMQALLIADENQSAKAILPLVHKSLLSSNHTELAPNERQFSFRKAHSNAQFYQVPVSITRTNETGQTQIGFADTAEAGKVIDYFIAKKAGVSGMPAAIKVFIPANGGAPKVSYMGNL